MAHNLTTNQNGQKEFFYNSKNGLPWHKLGQSIEGCQSWESAIELANLNWKVKKINLIHPITGERLENHYAIVREDNNFLLGIVGNIYNPIQNIDSFKFVDSLLESETGIHFDTAGSLNGGKQIFCSAELPFKIAPKNSPDDETKGFLMFTNSHDGKSKSSAYITTVRVVCNNTYNLVINGNSIAQLSVKHTGGNFTKLTELSRNAILDTKESVENLQKKFDLLSSRKMTKDTLSKTFKLIYGEKEKESKQTLSQIDKILTIYDNNDNNIFPENKETAYSLFQSFTNFVDHHKTVKSVDSKGTMTEELIRTESAVFGANAALKMDILDKILASTVNCPENVSPVKISVPSGIDNILSQMKY